MADRQDMDQKELDVYNQPNAIHVNPNFFKPANVYINPRFVNLNPKTRTLMDSTFTLNQATSHLQHGQINKIEKTSNEIYLNVNSKINQKTAPVLQKFAWRKSEASKIVISNKKVKLNAAENGKDQCSHGWPPGKITNYEGVAPVAGTSTFLCLPKMGTTKINNDKNQSEDEIKFTGTSKFKWTSKTQEVLKPKPTKYSWARRLSIEKSSEHSLKLPNIVRKSPKQCLKTAQTRPLSQTKIVSPSGNRLVRRSHFLLHKKTVFRCSRANMFKLDKVSKFKLDNRRKSEKSTAVNFKMIGAMFPKSRYTKNNIAVPTPAQKQRVKKKTSLFSNTKVVNIGGVLYRVTRNKLTRASLPATSTLSMTSNPIKHGKSKKHVLNVRGERFVLARNGKTLTRLSTKSPTIPLRQRIHFGGVTFQHTEDNVLVRTNTHRARQLVTSARHRSISCLIAHKRKINTPCVIFRKIGRCHRSDSGMCPYTHDRKNVDICKRFLRGDCTDTACLLSHDVGHHKVPTCRYFLEGTCGRDNCPYLHVKVSDTAEICNEFLQGYCSLGQECILRHKNICPVFESAGKCPKGRKCPYPHPKKTRKKVASRKPAKLEQKRSSGSNSHAAESSHTVEKQVRYYKRDCEGNAEIRVLPKRKRLDSLPSFIALDGQSGANSS